MKILQVNKFHYPRGGADKYFLDISAKLREEGHDVAVFAMQHPRNLPSPWSRYFVSRVSFNEGSLWQKLIAPGRMLYSLEAKRKFSRLLDDFQPDIIHVHNIYSQLSPSLLDAAAARRIPVVMHAHDYHLVSPSYSLFKDGQIYERCLGGHYFRCVADRCHKHSYAKSFLAAATLFFHNRILDIYRRRVSVFIAPSRFMAAKLRQGGFAGADIRCLPNFIADGLLAEPLSASLQGYILYFGRISEEKGIPVLLRALALLPDKELYVVGDGPQAAECEALAVSLGISGRVRFLPATQGDDLRRLVQGAAVVALPSIWYENMPLALLEALALGKTVVASRIGGLPEIVEDGINGWLCAPNDPTDLATVLERACAAPLDPQQVRASAEGFSLSLHYALLMQLYGEHLA